MLNPLFNFDQLAENTSKPIAFPLLTFTTNWLMLLGVYTEVAHNPQSNNKLIAL